jgi:protein-S-isoprenylcysteine O-methyltransferase Ste14
MSLFHKWAQKEYSLAARIIAILPAGVLFLGLLPCLFLVVCPSLDKRLGLDWFTTGIGSILVGGLLSTVGFALAQWSIFTQFTRGSGTPLPVMPTQELLTIGPFRYCRNPMTLGTILIYGGLTIAVVTVTGLTIVILLNSLLLLYLKLVEENELAERFGDEYLAYKREVPFILPRITRRN